VRIKRHRLRFGHVFPCRPSSVRFGFRVTRVFINTAHDIRRVLRGTLSGGRSKTAEVFRRGSRPRDNHVKQFQPVLIFSTRQNNSIQIKTKQNETKYEIMSCIVFNTIVYVHVIKLYYMK